MTHEELSIFKNALIILNELYGNALAKEKIYFDKQKAIKVIFDKKEQNGHKEEEKEVPKYGEGTYSKRRRTNRDGTLYTYWQGRFYYQGSQKTVTAKTKQECINKLKTSREGLKTKENTVSKYPINNLILFGDWLLKWYETYKQPFLAKSSQDSIITCIKKHIPESIKKTCLINLEAIKIQEALNEVKFERQKDIVFNIYSASLKKAYSIGLIYKPIWNSLYHKKHIYKKSKILSYEEEKKLLEYCRDDIKKIVICYLWTGCRRNELLNIKWKDINFDNNTIMISGTKTEKSNRIIPLFRKVKEVIGEPPLDRNEKIFNISSDRLTKLFKSSCVKANIENITIHSLRHTFASRLLNEYHLDIKSISTLLGHSSIKTTADIYLHHDEKFNKKIIEIVDSE